MISFKAEPSTSRIRPRVIRSSCSRHNPANTSSMPAPPLAEKHFSSPPRWAPPKILCARTQTKNACRDSSKTSRDSTPGRQRSAFTTGLSQLPPHGMAHSMPSCSMFPAPTPASSAVASMSAGACKQTTSKRSFSPSARFSKTPFPASSPAAASFIRPARSRPRKT